MGSALPEELHALLLAGGKAIPSAFYSAAICAEDFANSGNDGDSDSTDGDVPQAGRFVGGVRKPEHYEGMHEPKPEFITNFNSIPVVAAIPVGLPRRPSARTRKSPGMGVSDGRVRQARASPGTHIPSASCIECMDAVTRHDSGMSLPLVPPGMPVRTNCTHERRRNSDRGSSAEHLRQQIRQTSNEMELDDGNEEFDEGGQDEDNEEEMEGDCSDDEEEAKPQQTLPSSREPPRGTNLQPPVARTKKISSSSSGIRLLDVGIPNMPPTILFTPPKEKVKKGYEDPVAKAEDPNGLSAEAVAVAKELGITVIRATDRTPTHRDKRRGLFFQLGVGAVAFRVVLNAFTNAGFMYTKGDSWNVLWAKRLSAADWRSVGAYQRVNHFPGSWGVGRKDTLAKNMRRMQKLHGQHYGFHAQTWVLPAEARQLAAEYEARPGTIMIVKPVAAACGKGIRLINSMLPPRRIKSCIVQHYISNPLLIGGHKWDLRLYCAMTSVDPLRLYVFDDGLVRFATDKYHGTSKIKNRFAHLTNYSINKQSAKFQECGNGTTEDGEGHKWSLRALQKYFDERGLPWAPVAASIQDIMIKTFLSIEADLLAQTARLCTHREACFELFGFDIMIDNQFHCHLIEVNIMPSLAVGTALDKTMKPKVVNGLLTLIGVVPFDRDDYEVELDACKAQRLTARSRPRDNRGGGISTGETVCMPTSILAQAQNPSEKNSHWSLADKATRVAALMSGRPFHSLGLNDMDRFVISTAEAELRRGQMSGWTRIFPRHNSWDVYGRFFEGPRYYSMLLARWEKEKRLASQAPSTIPAQPSSHSGRAHAHARQNSAPTHRSSSSSGPAQSTGFAPTSTTISTNPYGAGAGPLHPSTRQPGHSHETDSFAHQHGTPSSTSTSGKARVFTTAPPHSTGATSKGSSTSARRWVQKNSLTSTAPIEM